MRTKAMKQGVNKEDLPPAVSTASVFSELRTTEQLRQITKQLKDYKHVADFAQSTVVEFKATVGEIRTARRTFRSEKAKLAAENTRINAALSKPTTPMVEKQKLLERQVTVQAKIAKISERQKDIKSFKGREEFKRAVEVSMRQTLKFDVEGWSNYQKNYMLRIMQLGDETGTDVGAILDAMKAMNAKQFAAWASEAGNDLSYQYDLGNNFATLARIAEQLDLSTFYANEFDVMDNIGIDY
jgi:hypothetical protein